MQEWSNKKRKEYNRHVREMNANRQAAKPIFGMLAILLLVITYFIPNGITLIGAGIVAFVSYIIPGD